MQYLEHALVGIAFLIFLGVVGLVGVALLVKAVRGARPKAPVATIYPIPVAERGSDKHVTLLDLVEEHLAVEEARQRRQKLRDRVGNWLSSDSPKS